MSAIDNNVGNPNFLSQLNFRFIMKRTPTLNYNCIATNIPGINLPAVQQPTPFVDIPQYGDKVSFNPFQATFAVDEDLVNYFEIHAWIRDLGKAENFAQHKALKEVPQYLGTGLRSDIVLSIMNSSRNSNFNVTYYDCIPIGLSDLWFNVQDTDIKILSATVAFDYLNYDYEKVVNS